MSFAEFAFRLIFYFLIGGMAVILITLFLEDVENE